MDAGHRAPGPSAPAPATSARSAAPNGPFLRWRSGTQRTLACIDRKRVVEAVVGYDPERLIQARSLGREPEFRLGQIHRKGIPLLAVGSSHHGIGKREARFPFGVPSQRTRLS